MRGPRGRVELGEKGQGASAFAATTPLGDLTVPSTPDDATIIPPDSLPDPVAAPEARGGRYERRSVLGAGGMGEVRAARDPWIGRDVAMKTLLPLVGLRAGARARFLREIRVQGQLEHPSIVPVYDLGAAEDGELWFTMRKIKGSTLASILERLASGDEELARRWGRRRLLTAFSTICMTIDYAHSRGVVHRDLKPANVMLGEFGEVYVLDWGIAKIIGGAGDEAVSVGEETTGEGKIIGTLGYMAPEQARGANVDARADVYSLGVILFELLTLQNLVGEGNPMQLLERVLDGVVASPRAAAPALDVPPELDEICLRATAKEPSGRFSSARALSEAVERYLDGDRDLERRKQVAAELVDSATARLASTARAGSEQAHTARVDVARDVLKALALNPDDERAQATLGRVLLEPPSDLPEAARREHDVRRAEERAEGAKLGVRAFVSYLLAFPLMWVAGVRSALTVLAGLVATLAAMLIARRVQAQGGKSPLGFYLLLSLSIAIVWLQSSWLGPFVLTPVASTITLSVFALYAERRERPAVIGAGVLMIALPFLFELVPGAPRAFSFVDGEIVLHARALHLPPTATLVGLVYTTLGFVLLPAIFLFRLRDALRVADERTFLQAWTVRQLFPNATARAERG